MKNKKTYIGTNFGHGSAACALNYQGLLTFAVEEDRIVKEKNTSRFPYNGINLILESDFVEDTIVWSEGWNIYKRFFLKGLLHSLQYFGDRNYYEMRLLKEWERMKQGYSGYSRYGTFNYIGHHASHAYSLIPFGLPKNSLIFISDTIGEFESISFFYWDGKMRLINRISHPNSFGSVFHQFAYHLGFKGRTGPGKLMALSGYGKPIWLENLNEISIVKKTDFEIFQYKYPSHRLKDAPDIFINKCNDTNLKLALIDSKNNYQKGKDIAASIQAWFTYNSWKLIEQNIIFARNNLKLKVDHIGFAGGAALNCQANEYFIKWLMKCDIGSVTISPWSEDSGTAIGAAVCSFIKANQGIEIPKAGAFLGPKVINQGKISNDLENDIKIAVEAILQGKLIALASGRLEFGPRALGGRCIIGNAFDLESKNKLNRCKNRPEFMPFAPAILEEDFDLLYYGNGSVNMAWTVKARLIAIDLIPSAIHITGGSRVQIVKSDNSLLYKLLICIKAKMGVGVVLLTSLNSSDETIPIYYNDVKVTSEKMKLHGILHDNGWENINIKG